MAIINNFNRTKLTYIYEKARYEEGLMLLLERIDAKIKALSYRTEKLNRKANKDVQNQLHFLQIKKREFRDAMNQMKKNTNAHWNNFKKFVEVEVTAFEKEAKLIVGNLDGDWIYFISRIKKF